MTLFLSLGFLVRTRPKPSNGACCPLVYWILVRTGLFPLGRSQNTRHSRGALVSPSFPCFDHRASAIRIFPPPNFEGREAGIPYFFSALSFLLCPDVWFFHAQKTFSSQLCYPSPRWRFFWTLFCPHPPFASYALKFRSTVVVFTNPNRSLFFAKNHPSFSFPLQYRFMPVAFLRLSEPQGLTSQLTCRKKVPCRGFFHCPPFLYSCFSPVLKCGSFHRCALARYCFLLAEPCTPPLYAEFELSCARL